MPKFVITAPDGKDYEVEGPEGATEEQALAHFQQNWKPEAEPSAPTRSQAEARRVDNAIDRRRSSLQEAYGPVAGSLAAGVGKTMSNFANLVEDYSPPTALIKAFRGGKRNPINQSLEDYSRHEYEAADPILAGGAHLASEIAATSPAASAVGGATFRALPNANRILRAGAAGATSGAVGGGLGGGGDAEERAENALKGAAAGAVLGGGIEAARPVGRYLSDFVPNPSKALRRAYDKIEGSLGGPQRMASVSSNLENPRALPMTTAAAAGDEGLMAMESAARAKSTPANRYRWSNVDESTQREAWNRLQQGTVAADDLIPRSVARDEALHGIQNQLDRMRLTQGAAQSLSDDIAQLARSPEFMNSQGEAALNRLAAGVQREGFTLGSLAHARTDPKMVGSLTDHQTGVLKEFLEGRLNQYSNGYWGQAMDEYRRFAELTDQSLASSKIMDQFQDIAGVAKGATRNELPKVTSGRLRGAMTQQGISDKGTLQARDILDPTDRAHLDELTRALQQAEAPAAVRAYAPEGGSVADALGNVPTGNMLGRSIRTVLGLGTKARDTATEKAIERALVSPRGWNMMVEGRNKAISDEELRVLERIIRAGNVSGALAND